MATKMTKKEMFAAIKEVVADNAEMVAFLDREIELLNRKQSGSRKPTKTQLENEGFKSDILEALTVADRPLTIKELCEECPSVAELSNQRITHMLTALRKDGKVTRTMVKRVAHFAIGNESEQGE